MNEVFLLSDIITPRPENGSLTLKKFLSEGRPITATPSQAHYYPEHLSNFPTPSEKYDYSTIMSKITEKGLKADVILQRESDRGGGRGHGVGQSYKVAYIEGINDTPENC